MNRTRKILTSILWATILVVLILAVLFELDILIPGFLSGSPMTEYTCAVVMEILTLVAIPLSLSLFKWKSIALQLRSKKASALLCWGTVRLTLLCLPILLNVLFYYAFLNPAFAYLAIILLLCLFFVYPSQTRCDAETREVNDLSANK